MSEPKPFASLSSGLLARKGAARPAMRPQGFSQSNSSLEDLGWNDMGGDQPRQAGPAPSPLEAADDSVVEHPRAHHSLGLTPVQSPVHDQQAEIADRMAHGAADEDAAEFDEEYDETAEPYEPEPAFDGFKSLNADEDDADEDEGEFRVQFKNGRKPLDMDALAAQSAAAPAAEEFSEAADDSPSDDVLDLGSSDHATAFEPDPMDVSMPTVDSDAPVAPPVLATPTPRTRALAGSKAKAAFTLRLDPDRHLKLRLACAVRGRSAQQLVTDALDALLSRMPELQDMAEKAQKRG